MTVLLLDRLARDIQRLGDLSPGPTVSQGPHDVLCLEVVSEDSKGPDGAEAVVGTEAVDHGSAHDATLVATWTGRNLSCFEMSPNSGVDRPDTRRQVRRRVLTPAVHQAVDR